MPPLTSRQKPKSSDEWVPVATFGVDSEADECVALLKGSAIPVMRVPPTNVLAVIGMGLMLTNPIRVLVPPEREAEARELLDDEATPADQE
jgi:hypothetical protein